MADAPTPRARFVDRALAIYGYGLGAVFLASVPLSLVQRELGAVRNWQLGLNAALFLTLASRRAFGELPAARVSKRARRFLLGAAAMSFIGCQLCKFYGFAINGVDFSIFDWMLESSWHGRFMYSPIYDVDHFGIHPTYFLLPLVPIHALLRSPLLLLGVSTALIWLGVLPCERLARRLTGSEGYGFLAAALYLTNPWVARLLDGGYRPEVGYPLFGLIFALGFVEERPRLWALGAFGLFSLKEDAGFYLAAVALGALVLERRRWREALALLVASVGVTAFDLAVVQPLCLQGHGAGQPEYLHFWSQYGQGLGEIARSMLTSPLRVARDVLTSAWPKLFGPALLLPLLSPLPLCGMLPALLLLGSASYRMMRGYLSYYPTPLVPFFLWGLLEAYPRLSRFPRVRDPVFAAALLLFPIVGDGYEKFDRPRWSTISAVAEANSALRAGSGPLCAQTILFPHLDYELAPVPLFPGCESRLGARLLIDLELDPWPYTQDQLQALTRGRSVRKLAPALEPGLLLLEPVTGVE